MKESNHPAFDQLVLTIHTWRMVNKYDKSFKLMHLLTLEKLMCKNIKFLGFAIKCEFFSSRMFFNIN